MNKKYILTAAIIVIAMLIFSCKTPATTTVVMAETTTGLTPEQEYHFGRAVSANILSSYSIWNGNMRLVNYINLICNAIAINSPRPNIFNGYRVAILDSNEINAFSTSGGHIFLTLGLVNAIRSEDALAAILAHEIAHIQLRHSVTQILLEIDTPDVNELTAIFNESVEEIVTMLVTNGYTQSQEFEADDLALNLMAWAGYNPKSYLDMLRDLSIAQNRSRGGFNNTHPTPAQRAENVEVLIGSFNMPDTRVHRQIRFVSVGMSR